MQLSIIIVSFNTQQLTLQTVKSVLAELNKNSTLKAQTEVLLIDNHSTDGSVASLQKLKKQHPQLIKLVLNSKNLGFAQANNQGLKQAQGEYIFLLNSDTIVQPGALTRLLQTFKSNPIKNLTANLSSHQGELDKLGLLAATLLNQDGSIQPQGGSFPNLISLFCHMLLLDDLPLIGKVLPSTQHTGRRFNLNKFLNHKKPVQQEWVGATALMIRKQVFTEIGLLDQNIFMYGEDVEFCLRAKHHHWDIALNPQAKVTHLGSASSSSTQALIGEIKSYLYIWSKHKPAWQMPFLKTILWLGALLRIILFDKIVKDQEKAQAYQKIIKQL